jgi:hypothetical protein
MEIETEMEMDMETETETDNTRTWTWNWRTFVKYFIRRNCPYSAKWNASEIARHNSQLYTCSAPSIWKKIILLLE